MANRFVFGNVSAAGTRNQIGVKKNRTILLVGSSESDKTSLINAMANFALNVDGQDPFRFHLVPEEADDSKINVYDLRHVDGFRIQHLLTVIDTPSYDESDPEKNEKITDMVDAYFKDENAIQEIDVVGFVMNSPIGSLSPLEVHIYCSLISIFGNKIKEDVNFLFTYADEEELAVFEAHDEAVLVTTPFQKSHPCSCSFSVFEDGKVVKDKLRRLLYSPIELKFKKEEVSLVYFPTPVQIIPLSFTKVYLIFLFFKSLRVSVEEQFPEDGACRSPGLEPDADGVVAGASGYAEHPSVSSSVTAVSPNFDSMTEDEQIAYAMLKSLQESRRF